MLAYLQANLAAPAGPLGKAMAMAQEPRFDSDAEGRPMKVGLVWNVDPRTGIIWHNGETGGYYSFIALDRANHNGIVLLANVADPHIDTLAMHLLEPDAVSAAPSWPAVVQVAPATIDTYVGTYQISPNFTLTITHDGQRVYAKGTGQANVRIYPSSPTEFFARAIDAQITFELDPSGHVVRLILHQFGRDAAAPKVK
jgi:CubicO group peptidase (beta-lactamase class C family)